MMSMLLFRGVRHVLGVNMNLQLLLGFFNLCLFLVVFGKASQWIFLKNFLALMERTPYGLQLIDSASILTLLLCLILFLLLNWLRYSLITSTNCMEHELTKMDQSFFRLGNPFNPLGWVGILNSILKVGQPNPTRILAG